MLTSYKKFFLSPLAFAISVSVIGPVAAGQKLSIPLSGTAVVNEVTNMSVNPALVDLGAVEVGSEVNQTITLSNLGGGDENSIQINGLMLGGANSNEFTVQLPADTTLDPGESVDISITFFPATTGGKTATLSIDHDGANAEHVIFLKAIGADQPVSELIASPGNLGMGTIEMGQTSNKNITLTNQGEQNAPQLTIESAEITGENAGDFSVNFGAQLVLDPGKSSPLKVTMSSGTFGNKSAILTLKNSGVSPTVKINLSGKVNPPDDGGEPEQDPEFDKSKLSGLSITRPTTLQFGPDGKLYVGQMNGLIKVLTINRQGANDFKVTNTETIDLVNKMVNHDDDGTVNNAIKGRLLTGLLVTGTENNPEIYLVSGDPRQGAGPSGEDKNLDTNSGILSHIYKQGGTWVKDDLVRGMPRSEENHQGNGLVFDKNGTKLLVSTGGNTNMGAPSHNFAFMPEVALSAAILEIDIGALGNTPYDIPTLDDEDRPGVNDQNDPFGGNNGKNQAILEANGPVKIYSPGFRNAYDLVLTESDRLYTIDNGGNAGWGGETPANCSNDIVEAGTTYRDGLHYISHRGYYGGHPNPTRGKASNTFNDSNPQSAVEVASNPVECNFLAPGIADSALDIFMKSTNGLDEYTASNFGGAMKGDLLAASFDKAVWRIELNNAGDILLSKSKLFPDSGIVPLDVTSQGDDDVFPGTVWVTDFNSNAVNVFEPEDYLNLGGATVLDDAGANPGELQNDIEADGTYGDTEAMLLVVPSHLILSSSTFKPGSFQLTNNSGSGQTIESVIIDTSSAILPDIVFDPYALAGDPAGKDLTADSDESLVGLVGHSFGKENGGGYHQLKIDFSHFDPEETFSFSIDTDPTSVNGADKPGPHDSASVSGLELSGSRITVFYSDGAIKSNDLFVTSFTDTFSNTKVKESTQSRPGLSVVGLTTPATVTDQLQTIRVSGKSGSEVRLVIAEAGLYLDGVPNGGYDIDPYEANTTLGVDEYRATIGANGEVDIPVTLKKSEAEGGLNYISATVVEDSGDTGLVSDTLVLQLY